jgi:ribosomal protein L44E
MDSQSSIFSNNRSSVGPESSISHQESPESEVSLAKRRKLRATEVWNHFREPQGNEPAFNKQKQRLHYCSRCKSKAWSSGTTKNAKNHLEKEHGIKIDNKGFKNHKARQESLSIAFQRQANRSQSTSSGNQLTRESFNEAMIQLIANCNLPLSSVEWPEMQALLLLCNPQAESYLIESRSSIPRLLTESFGFHQKQLKARLHASQSKIHLSMDLWTSPNRRAYLAIVAHWVDQWVKQKALLALPRLHGSHGGKLQSVHVMETLQNYEVFDKLGYCTSDNASSNDSLLQHLSTRLLEEHGIEYDAVQHRIRCSGHIINLSLQAFLFAKNEAAVKLVKSLASLDEEVDVDAALQDIIEQPQSQKRKGKAKEGTDSRAVGWRSIGPLGM